MARLSGLRVLVTGASTDLGRATVSRLVAEGVDVLAGTREPASVGFADPIAAVELDVTDPDAWSRIAAGIDGDLHGLVNIAATVRTGPLTEMAPADLRRMLDVNLLGPTLGIATMAPIIAASGGGSIVNVAAAESSLRGVPSAAAFAATGWGLRGLTRSAALELGPRGIRVNTVCPASGLVGPTEPRLADGEQGRTVTHGDVAAMVAFLLSDDSATCSGGDFLVDAGGTA